MPEAVWKKLKTSNLKKITRKKSRKNRSLSKKKHRVRKQRGGGSNLTPFGDSGGVPSGLGGTVTTMSDEGVPLTKSLSGNNDEIDE